MASMGRDELLAFTDTFIMEQMRAYKTHLEEKGNTTGAEFAYAHCILQRIRPRTVYEVAFLSEGEDLPEYDAVKQLVEDEIDALASALGVGQDFIGYTDNTVVFCEQPHPRVAKPPNELQEDLAYIRSVKVERDGEAVPITSDPRSLIGPLSRFKWKVRRIFYVEPVAESRPDYEAARRRVNDLVKRRCR